MSDSPPRRSPDPDERQRDAERSRRRLLAAAFDEFAAHGYAGARVGRIAELAGVNKQLISYYFGSKEGLYRALRQSWLDQERAGTGLDVPVQEMMRWYLHGVLSDPRGTRLLLWRSLSDDTPEVEEQDDADAEQDRMRQRQAAGELDPELDPAALQLAWMGMVIAPVVLPRLAEQLLGAATDTPEFETRYGDALVALLARLAPPTSADSKGNPST